MVVEAALAIRLVAATTLSTMRLRGTKRSTERLQRRYRRRHSASKAAIPNRRRRGAISRPVEFDFQPVSNAPSR